MSTMTATTKRAATDVDRESKRAATDVDRAIAAIRISLEDEGELFGDSAIDEYIEQLNDVEKDKRFKDMASYMEHHLSATESTMKLALIAYFTPNSEKVGSGDLYEKIQKVVESACSKVELTEEVQSTVKELSDATKLIDYLASELASVFFDEVKSFVDGEDETSDEDTAI